MPIGAMGRVGLRMIFSGGCMASVNGKGHILGGRWRIGQHDVAYIWRECGTVVFIYM